MKSKADTLHESTGVLPVLIVMDSSSHGTVEGKVVALGQTVPSEGQVTSTILKDTQN